jgi:hypothetical protein
VRLDGRVTALRPAEPDGSAVWGLAWTTPPRGVRYRKPAPPAGFPVAASAFELKSKAPIDELVADGRRVAFRSCREIVTWTAGTTTLSEVHPERPVCVGPRLGEEGWDVRFCCTALAGDNVGVETVQGSGIQRSAALSVYGPSLSTGIAALPTMLGGSLGIGFMVGHGPLLVFSAWRPSGTACIPTTPCPDPRGQPLWRLPLPLSSTTCALDSSTGDLGPPCQKIAAGPVLPLAADDSHIVVRRVDGALAVLDADGREVFSIPFATADTWSAKIAASDVVVLTAGQLRDYDVTSRALLHAWPVPPESRLEDTARGLAAYVLDGQVHLLRLRDGADVVVASGTGAQLEDSGLFYAHDGAAPYVGRIRFVARDKLPLR